MHRTLSWIAVVLASNAHAFADQEVAISPATRDAQNCLVHDVTSPYQQGTTHIRVLLPDRLEPGRKYPAVYVLPVEAARQNRYGDGLAEIHQHDLANRMSAVFVAPTFSALPWYADHPADPAIRQETYLLHVVIPAVEARYPVAATARDRLLMGFSKSGWGAWSMLLRHPTVFGKAVAWDAPLMMDRPGRYGSGEIFATRANFEKYHVSRLARDNAQALRTSKRLILLGYDNFGDEHRRMHALLDGLHVPHEYRDGPKRSHDWHSGWVAEAVQLLLDPSK